MYKRDELIAVKKEFWVKLGQYLSPVPSAFGLPVNWINYKSGIKNIQVKLHADTQSAAVILEVSGDATQQQKIIAMLRSLNHSWPPGFHLIENFTDEHGRELARLQIETSPVNIMDKASWPDIISFLKTHIIAFDAFWAEVKDIFEMSL